MAGIIKNDVYDPEITEQLAKLNPTWQQTMIRIRDPKLSLPFYIENFGMTLVGEFEFGPGKGDFTVFFLATLTEEEKKSVVGDVKSTPNAYKNVFDARKGMCFIELTWNHGTEKQDCPLPVTDHSGRKQLYSNGNEEPLRGFGHIAFNTADVYKASETLLSKGVKFKKKPDEGNMKGLAFALDPDGYWIEIVRGEQNIHPDRFNLSQTMIRIQSPKSADFYSKIFDMPIVSKRDFPQWKFTLFFLATRTEVVEKYIQDSPESVSKLMWDPCLELTYNYGTEDIETGTAYYNGNSADFNGKPANKGFGHIGWLVDDLNKFCELLEKLEIEFIKKPQDGRMRNLAFIKDPSGYFVEIIQRGASF